jgi:hypothetical protein
MTDHAHIPELKEAKAILELVEEHDLRAIAKHRQINIPPNATKKDIVEILLGSGLDLRDLVRSAVRLELKSTELSVLDRIEQRATAVIADLKAQIKAGEDSIRTTIETLQSTVKTVMWVFGAVAGAIAIVGGVSEWFVHAKAQDLDETLKAAEQQLAALSLEKQKTSALRDQFGAMVSVYRQYMIDQWANELHKVMESFSSSFIDESLFEKMKREQEPIRKMIEISRFDTNSEESVVLGRLDAFYKGLESFEEYKQPGVSDQRSAEILNAALNKWKDVPVLDVNGTDPAYQPFIRRTNAYRDNILGVIYLNRYLALPTPRPDDDLYTAEDYFSKAISIDDTLARPYGNQAVVLYYRLHVTQDLNEQTNLIARALQLLQTSENNEQDSRARSLLHNNIASYILLRARMAETRKDLISAEAEVKEADQELNRAENEEAVAPAVFVTRAEIRAYSLHLQLMNSNGVDVGKAMGDIVHLIEVGIGRGYLIGHKKVTDYPYFEGLRSIDAPGTDTIFDLLHVDRPQT